MTNLAILELFTKPKPKPLNAVDLLQQISRRAEDLTAEEQAKSFVTIRRIDGALKNRDSRIILGRRGTGKTHILSYVAKTARDRGEVPCVIDLRTLGSNNSIYSNTSIPPHVRVTTLIRDLLTAIHDRILDLYTEPKSELFGEGLVEALDGLSACVRTVVVADSQETRGKSSADVTASSMVGGEIKASAIGIDGALKSEGSASEVKHSESETTVTGTPRLSLNMGDVYGRLNDIASKSKSRIWILLDEWSSLPELLQPYLADFIRRAILPIQRISIQIAAIEFRSKFRLDHEEGRVGFELGSDIAADINLDDYFIYDASPKATCEFFGQLLYRHLSAFAGEAELTERNAIEVISSIFSQDRVFSELARASEGVARDFINILQLAAMRSDHTKISMNEVRSAAKDWYERDKQRNLDSNPKAQALLDWIRDEVIEGKRARAFLLRSDASNGEIEFLFDERVLHIARRAYSAKDDPGVRYRVWKVDYGCYVDLINTASNPIGYLFEGSQMVEGGDIEVPDDDYRAVRRAILNLSRFEQRLAHTSSLSLS